MEENQQEDQFSVELIKSYPRANQKLNVEIGPYTLATNADLNGTRQKCLTTFISPFGLEFQGNRDYPEGTLLKISVSIPDYWTRKKKFVEYSRIDTPNDFKILARVVGSQDIGKRRTKKLILAQTVNIDDVDKQVLQAFLNEGK